YRGLELLDRPARVGLVAAIAEKLPLKKCRVRLDVARRRRVGFEIAADAERLAEHVAKLARDRRRDLALQREDVRELAVERVRPKASPGRSADEIDRDAHLVRGLAHAAFEEVRDAERRRDSARIVLRALEPERGASPDHGEPADLAERSDQLLGKPVG